MARFLRLYAVELELDPDASFVPNISFRSVEARSEACKEKRAVANPTFKCKFVIEWENGRLLPECYKVIRLISQ